MTHTNLKYLNDTSMNQGTALFVRSDEDERGSFLVLDGTIFYPQGGGQPSDTGIIAFESGRIELSDVRYYSGEVRHYFVGADSFPTQGDQIKMQIDLCDSFSLNR